MLFVQPTRTVPGDRRRGREESVMCDLTRAFAAYQAGDRAAFDQIFAAMYPELIRLARSRLRAGQRMTLVDTTMLVHECFLRFLNSGQMQIESRGHFFAYAARVMRSIIVDHARRRKAEQRGGDLDKVPFDTALADSLSVPPEDGVLEIAEAVDRLARHDERRYLWGK